MIRRTSIVALELVAGLLGVAAIAFAVLFWRLTIGPISLGFATPYIERALSIEQSAIAIKIQDTDLIWAGWDKTFDIRVNHATVLGSGGKILMTLPEVSVGFSVAALMKGHIAPTRFEIHGLNAAVERGPDGKFAMGFFAGRDRAADRDFVDRIPTYIDRLMRADGPDAAFRYLQVVRITDVDIRFNDRVNGAVWHAPDTDIEILRESEGLEAIASMGLKFGDRSTRLTAHAVFAPDRPIIDLAIDFDKLVPSDLARRLPGFQPLERVGIPFSGQFRAVARYTGVVESLAFDLKGAGGSIAGNVIVEAGQDYDMTLKVAGLRGTELTAILPESAGLPVVDALLDVSASARIDGSGEFQRFEASVRAGAGAIQSIPGLQEPLEFDRIAFQVEARDHFSVATLRDVSVSLNGAQAAAQISAHRIGGEIRTRIEAEANDFDIANLVKVWPRDIGSPAYDWTTQNIRSGHVDRGTLALTLQVPVTRLSETVVQSVSGTLKYHDLTVRYFPGFPMITNVAGTATFAKDRFDLDVSRGKLLDVEIDHGVVSMTALDTDNERISIDVVVRGQLATALTLANRDPLRLVGEVGIDPGAVGGEMAARLGFRFPLRRDVRLDQITVASAANLRDVSMNPGPFGFELANSNLELKLTNSTLKVGGHVELNGVPMSIDWHELVGSGGEFRSRYILSGDIDISALQRIGLPPIPYVGGRAEMNVIFTRFSDGRGELLASGDLKNTVMTLPQVGWLKPAGLPGSLRLSASLNAEGVPAVENLSVTADDLEVVGAISFGVGGDRNWEAKFTKFMVGNSDVQGSVRQFGNGNYLARIDRGVLDIEPFMVHDGAAAREIEARRPQPEGTISIDLNLDSVRTSPTNGFGATRAQARLLGDRLDLLSVTAALPESGNLHVDFAPLANGGHTLDVRSDNAGQALLALDLSDNLEGGTLVINGKRPHEEAAMKGAFSLTNYKLLRAPALARLLQVASLTGIFDALQRGLDFVEFDGTYAYRDSVLEIDRSRSYGSSIGITVEGKLDLSEDVADMSGTVVPAYTVNRVLGQIPILGPILTGGKDEGVFAATYAVSGALEDPVIAVNPLSALAPGFLRKLFDQIGSGGTKANETSVPAPSTQ